MRKKTLSYGTDRLYGAFTGVCHMQQMRQREPRRPKRRRLRRRKMLTDSESTQRGWEMTSTVSAWSLTVR